MEIEINDELIDLGSPQARFAMTYQINDIAELKDRQSNISNRAKAPVTNRNDAIFGNCSSVQSQSGFPYKKAKAKVRDDDGSEIVANGTAVVDSAGGFYNFTIYSGLLSFFDLIEGKNISDLDLSAYNHLWNFAYTASQIAIAGIKYPIIDYGNIPITGIDVKARELFPSIQHQVLIDEIIKQAGFTYKGKVFSNPKYLAEYLPFSNERLQGFFPTKSIVRSDVVQNNTYGYWLNDIYISDNPNGFWVRKFDPAGIYFPPSGSGGGVSNTGFLAHEDKTFDFHYHYELINSALSIFPIQLVIQTISTSGVLNSYTTILTPAVANAIIDGTFSISLLKGEQVFFYLYFVIQPYTVKAGSYVEVTNITDFPLYPIDQDFESTTVSVKDNFPLDQKGIIKAWMQRYCLIVDVDPYTRVIDFKYFDEIRENAPLAKDVTDKVNKDYLKNNDYIDPRAKGYGQKNYMKWEVDSSDVDKVPNLGDGYFSIADANLPVSFDVFTQPYASTVMVKRLSTQFDVPLIRKFQNGGSTLENGTTQRLLILYDQMTGGGALRYVDGSRTQNAFNVPLARFILPLQAYNLDFQNDYIPEYYEAIIYVLNNFIKLTIEMDWRGSDIHTLNHFIPVFIELFNAYFYINKISNYTSGKFTKTELIRIQ